MRRCERTAVVWIAATALLAGCDRGSRPGQIGQVAPEFALNDGAQSVDLAHLRGQVVVLNFWATWCAPCVEELPSLMALQHAMPSVKVVAVSTDTDAQVYSAFLQRHQVDLLSVRDGDEKSNALYGSFRYPETYIIDKQGLIRRKLIGPQDFSSPEIVDFLRKLSA